MSGTIKITAICTVLLLFAAAAALASPTPITRLQLSHEGSFTVLTIEGNGPIRTAHQSVEAKEGKPFRIVVDCLASRHAMKEKDFEALPPSAITAIRTSQYAVTPEEVVRVVLDLQVESVYRVQELPNAVKVLVSDPKAVSFTAWNSDVAVSGPQQPKKVVAATLPVPVQDKPTSAAAQVVASKESTTAKTPSIIKAHKQVAEQPTAKSEPVIAQNNPPAASKSETRIPTADMQTAAKAEAETGKYQKPVPLQVKLGLTSDNDATAAAVPTKEAVKVETKSVPTVVTVKPETKAEAKPAVKPQVSTASVAPKSTVPTTVTKAQSTKETTKEQPVIAQAKQETAKQTSAPKAVAAAAPTKQTSAPSTSAEPVRPTKAQESKPRTLSILNDTIDRALAFAAIINSDISAPPPGDLPKKPGAPSTDIHKSPAATAKTAEKPVVKTSQAKEPVLASVTTETKALPENPGAAQQIASPPAPEKQLVPPVATATTQNNSEPEAVSKRPSRFRREAAKSVRLREAQVVQFPQRIVIKYGGASERDPFQTLIDIDKKTQGVDLNKIPNIETLHLVGVLESQENGGKDAALMEDRDGIGYILKSGDRVRNGYVAQIDDQAVYFQITEYGWSRTVVKELEKEK